ncbi:MAG: HAMP domain-containing sensor histidine kinase, partial [Pseudomonadota bacterium]|nr:HAMP domain-containing sensor histidine kinase [Pseudomonadota bacterium]
IGVLLLTSPPGEIDRLVAAERTFLAKVFLVVLSVTLVLSFALAGTITMPVRRLATAIQAFQGSGGPLPAPSTVPDFSNRQDEIGDLSLALRDMLNRLVNRLDTIENFAADVAHELKNPLASINSAVQSLAATSDDGARQELMGILQDDILRMNRLITDISEASRLDAELGRATAENFDLSDLLKQMIPLVNSDIQLKIKTKVSINAQKDRIAQIIRNLLDNALSFSPAQDITVRLDSDRTGIFVHVDDAGPGLPDGVEQKIFDRFYTDRPDGHDLHSGLGLSISQQIARAHGGNLTARNRINAYGSRFTLFLPHQGK